MGHRPGLGVLNGALLGKAKYWIPTDTPVCGCATNELIAAVTPVHFGPSIDADWSSMM
jgi:hypothetical protein